MPSFVLNYRWQEPSPGSASFVAVLEDKDEENHILDIITWLNEEAGDECGVTLAQWDMQPTKAEGGDFDHRETIDEIILQSRYSEDDNERGGLYGGECPFLVGWI